jgi:hypothetical protein
MIIIQVLLPILMPALLKYPGNRSGQFDGGIITIGLKCDGYLRARVRILLAWIAHKMGNMCESIKTNYSSHHSILKQVAEN